MWLFDNKLCDDWLTYGQGQVGHLLELLTFFVKPKQRCLYTETYDKWEGRPCNLRMGHSNFQWKLMKIFHLFPTDFNRSVTREDVNENPLTELYLCDIFVCATSSIPPVTVVVRWIFCFPTREIKFTFKC